MVFIARSVASSAIYVCDTLYSMCSDACYATRNVCTFYNLFFFKFFSFWMRTFPIFNFVPLPILHFAFERRKKIRQTYVRCFRLLQRSLVYAIHCHLTALRLDASKFVCMCLSCSCQANVCVKYFFLFFFYIFYLKVAKATFFCIWFWCYVAGRCQYLLHL